MSLVGVLFLHVRDPAQNDDVLKRRRASKCVIAMKPNDVWMLAEKPASTRKPDRIGEEQTTSRTQRTKSEVAEPCKRR